jgi:hypothetical protein
VVYFCCLSYGNLLCLANDPIKAPDEEGSEELVMAPNAAVVPVLAGGLPAALVVAVREIAAGDEIVIDYGRAYWRAWRMLRRNTDLAAARGGARAGG